MAVIDSTYIMTNVKKLLPLGQTEMFDDQLDILIGGAINKLIGEGIDIDAKDKDGNSIFVQGSNIAKDYVICVSYQLMKDLDYDVNMDYLTEQYITRIGTMRCYITMKQR